MAARISPARRAGVLAAAALLAALAAAPAHAGSFEALPDLSLAGAPTAAELEVGGRLSYSLTAANGGGGVATGVLLQGTLEGPASLVSAQTSRGTCAVVERTVTCALGTLVPGASASATVVVEAGGPGLVVARLAVASNEPDANAADNTLERRVTATLGAAAVRLPAAGPLVWRTLTARAAPSADARAILVFHDLRRDRLPQFVLARGRSRDAQGRLWYRVELPMRPNGRLGWVRADGVALKTVRRTLLVDLSARRLTVLAGTRVLMRTRVAVGKPGMETPTGRFYLTAKFKPTAPILGAFALETSAYSRLTDWPGGGLVGIHGTPMPWLLGQAVSHGCIRVANTEILRIARLVPTGTPVRIVP